MTLLIGVTGEIAKAKQKILGLFRTEKNTWSLQQIKDSLGTEFPLIYLRKAIEELKTEKKIKYFTLNSIEYYFEGD